MAEIDGVEGVGVKTSLGPESLSGNSYTDKYKEVQEQKYRE